MKFLLLLILGFSYFSTLAQKNVVRYEIEEKRLLTVLTKLADTISQTNNGKGFMEIHFDIASIIVDYAESHPAPDTYVINLKDKSLDVGLEFIVLVKEEIWTIPTAYTVINDVPCFIYTGLEPLMKEERATMKKLKTKFKHHEGRVSKYVGWDIIMKNDDVFVHTFIEK